MVRNQKIGFVFQTFNLLPRTTALENVELPLLYSTRRDVAGLPRRALEAVGFPLDRLRHHPGELSGGQQQRVALARAIVNDPEIVFANEPIGNLDTQSSTEIIALFQRLNAQGRTVVVTHEPDVARYARRIISISDGAIVQGRDQRPSGRAAAAGLDRDVVEQRGAAMRARTAGKVARAGLSRNRLRTFLMMIGIVVGITALTLVLSAGLGAEKRVMERVKKFGLSSLMVSAGGGTERGRTAGATSPVTLKLSDAEALTRDIQNVEEVAPFTRLSGGDVSWSRRPSTVGVFGVTPAWAPVWDWDAAEGELITDEDMTALARVAVLGRTARKDLFGDADPMGEIIQIGSAPFVVKGVMEAKGTSPGGGDMHNRVYVPLSTLMRRLANVDYLNGIKVRLRSAENIDRAVPAIRALLREQHRLPADAPDDFSITTPTEITQMAGKVAGTFNVFLVLVAGISLLAGASSWRTSC